VEKWLNFPQAIRQGYIARAEQLLRSEEVLLAQGSGRGLSCQEIALPNGLDCTMVWDRCMDISRLRYMGYPISFASKNMEASCPSSCFEHNFPGWMLYTCGLLNVGPGDHVQPTHGRIHTQAATLKSTRRTSQSLIFEGEMHETALFGESLQFNRRLTFPLEQSVIHIHDTITNQTPYEQPVMLLYHINLGYPFLSEHMRLSLPEGTKTIAATEDACLHQDELAGFTPPQPAFQEQDYHHWLPAEDGYCSLSAMNQALGIGLKIRYKADTLPILVQWRCLRSGDYVLGLEPSNNRVNGRTQAIEHGELKTIAPFASLDTDLSLSFFTTHGEKNT